jgi:hypothetical protein
MKKLGIVAMLVTLVLSVAVTSVFAAPKSTKAGTSVSPRFGIVTPLRLALPDGEF